MHFARNGQSKTAQGSPWERKAPNCIARRRCAVGPANQHYAAHTPNPFGVIDSLDACPGALPRAITPRPLRGESPELDARAT